VGGRGGRKRAWEGEYGAIHPFKIMINFHTHTHPNQTKEEGTEMHIKDEFN
jgi:hypothetical protein